MSISAANPAGPPNVSLCIVGLANESAPSCDGGGKHHPSCDGHASLERAPITVAFRSQGTHENFVLKSVCRFVSRLCSDTASGLFIRPAAARSSASLRRPAGYGFPPNLVRKKRRKDFSGTSVNAELRHLGAWPTRFMMPRPRSGDSTNGDHHVPEQSNPHRLPR